MERKELVRETINEHISTRTNGTLAEQWEIRDSFYVFTKTRLHHHIPDQAATLDGSACLIVLAYTADTPLWQK